MYIITNDNCQNCNMLKTMLGEKVITTKFIKASDNMDLCKRLNIRQVPALVKDDESVVFDLEEIVTEVEKVK